MTESMIKIVNLRDFTVQIEKNKFIKGFVMKRKLTENEAIYVFEHCLGGVPPVVEDFQDVTGEDGLEEYQSFVDDLVSDINDWLAGKLDDEAISYYFGDCTGEQLGIWNAFSIAEYLIDIDAI